MFGQSYSKSTFSVIMTSSLKLLFAFSVDVLFETVIFRSEMVNFIIMTSLLPIKEAEFSAKEKLESWCQTLSTHWLHICCSPKLVIRLVPYLSSKLITIKISSLELKF